VCCATLSATLISTATETVKRHETLRTCSLSKCGYVYASLGRAPLSQRCRRWPSQRTIQHPRDSAPERSHGTQRPCWYRRHCKGFIRSSLSTVPYSIVLSAGVRIGYSGVAERFPVSDSISTLDCTQREPTMGARETAHRSTAASTANDRRRS
jgi:hypothetical protein